MNPNQTNEPGNVIQPSTTPKLPAEEPMVDAQQVPRNAAYGPTPLPQPSELSNQSPHPTVPVVGQVSSASQQAYPQSQNQGSSVKRVLTIIVIIVLGLSVLFLGWKFFGRAKNNLSGSSSKSNNNSSATNNATSQYVDSQGRFKITPPLGWKTLTPVGIDLADFQSQNADSYGVPHINIISTPVPGSSLSELVSDNKATAAQKLENYQDLGSQPETISGLPAELLTSSSTLQGHDPSINNQLIVVKDGTLYVVTSASYSSTWTKDKDYIQKSLLSFTF